MIEACTKALRHGTCQLAPTDAAPPANAVAVVSWMDRAHSQVFVEVGVSHGASPRWMSRRMQFRRVDALSERWRVVGLTIATLVGDLEDERSPQPDRVDPRPAPSTSPQVAGATATPQPESPVSARSEPRWSAGAGLSADLRESRIGAYGRGSWIAPRPVYATLAVSFLIRPRDERGVGLTWAALAAGGGVSLDRAGLPLMPRLRVEVLVDRIAADVQDPEADASDAQWMVLPGWRGAFELTWPKAGTVGLVAGLSLDGHFRPIRVRIAGEQVGRFPALAYIGGLGMEVRL
jgi:hypothetical protein